MSGGNLAQIAQELAASYPAADVEATQRELRRVLDVALITLAPKAQATRRAGKSSILEVWKTIRRDAEADFQPALVEVERLKVVYVASKFMNNRAVGTAITEAALALAEEKEGEGD
jgi:hypothetical protein